MATNETTKETEFIEKVIALVSDSCHRVLPNEGDIIRLDDTYKPIDSNDKWRAGDEFRFTAISRGYRRTYIECVATKVPDVGDNSARGKVGEEVVFCTSNSAVYRHLHITDVCMRKQLRTMVQEYIKGLV